VDLFSFRWFPISSTGNLRERLPGAYTGTNMPKQKLTPDFVRHAKPLDGSQRTYFWDATLPRFGLMVTANGAKSYVVQYRHRGSSRRLTMDGALPLSDARPEAQAVIGRVAKGEDVVEQRRKEQRQKVNAFEQIGREYLKRNGSKRSLWQYRDVLDRLIISQVRQLANRRNQAKRYCPVCRQSPGR